MKITLPVREAACLEMFYLKAYLGIAEIVTIAALPADTLKALKVDLDLPDWLLTLHGVTHSNETPDDMMVQLIVTDPIEQRRLIGHTFSTLMRNPKNIAAFYALLEHGNKDEIMRVIDGVKAIYDKNPIGDIPYPAWLNPLTLEWAENRTPIIVQR